MSSLSTFQESIVTHCTEHAKNFGSIDFRPCVVHEGYFIKYGNHLTLCFEYETQKYIYSIAVGDASAPRVPKVYDYFTHSNCMGYLVMEYIKSTPAQDAPEMVARALQWLRNVPAPPNVTIGSVGGGPARHGLFKDYRAPQLSNKEALERYMNKALEWIPKTARPTKVSFGNEQLVFTQSDMHESNFLIDTNGKICIIDFGDVGILPESFASYTVHSGSGPFASKVAEHLNWPRTANLPSMARIGRILISLSDRTLGLDEAGLPISRC